METLTSLLNLFQSRLVLESLTACIFLGMTCGLTGSFLILQRQALAGDMIGHSVLPGICLAFIASQFNAHPLVLLLGAFLGALCSTIVHGWLTRSSKIKPEMALAINLTGFYAIGLSLLTWIQNLEQVKQTHLESYLLGQAASLSTGDLWLIIFISCLTALMIVLLFKELRISIFDADFAHSQGIKPQKFSLLLSTMVAVSVVVSIKAVGLILVSALLIIPSATASLWTKDLKPRLVLSAGLGALSALVGGLISLFQENFSTGPSIILVSTLVFVFSLFIKKLKEPAMESKSVA